MRVLVTGFGGYIGPVIVERLKAAGHYVIGWDTGWFLPNYAETPEWPDLVRFVDIRDARLWPEKVDAVVHLAGLSNDPLGALNPELTRDINVAGTLLVAGVFRKARHVVFSSCSVYGTNDMAREESVPAPLTEYARAKADVDVALHDVDPRPSVVSLRLGTVYGYSPGHRLDLVVNRMVYDAVSKGVVTATGNAARPLVHVEDVADAVAFMLGREETGIYNVVGENVRMHDLARVIGQYAGATIDLRPSDADARDYMADGTKLWSLGFNPKRSVLGSLPVLFEKTINLPLGEYRRLPALQRLLGNGYLDKDLRHRESIAA